MDALNKARVDSRYSNLLKNIYDTSTMQVTVNEDWKTAEIPAERGVRQGDPISPKLFTLAMEYAFQNLNWDSKGIQIDGTHLNHLRFADDIVLISSDPIELTEMLTELNDVSKEVGLVMNVSKTKVMSPTPTQVIIGGREIENVKEYVYLGHKLVLGKENQSAELRRRIGLSWAAFGRLRYIFKNKRLPINLKRKVFETCVLPVITYGVETMTLSQRNADKLRTTQRAMEREILGVSLRDRIRNEDIRARTGLTDVVARAASLKWRWAGHVVRGPDEKWTKRLLCWRPRATVRNRGRPQLRWRDDIRRSAGAGWMRLALDRDGWKRAEEAYVQEWTSTG
jgi:hypothetical protein